MPRAAKITIGLLAAAVIVLGAVVLGGVGQKNQRVLRAEAVEAQLPGAMNERLAKDETATGLVSKAGCVRKTDQNLRCMVTVVDGESSMEVPVAVTVDTDRGTFVWEVEQ